jgi:nucleoside-diphosphate-sugar epimerase
MKRALVCGAGGFIGGHPSASLRAGPSTGLRAGLVKKLKREGYWVRGVDLKEHR